jgi:hypothetical protein
MLPYRVAIYYSLLKRWLSLKMFLQRAMLIETLHTHDRALSTLGLLVGCDEFTEHTAQHATPSTDVSVASLLCLFGPNFQVKAYSFQMNSSSFIVCSKRYCMLCLCCKRFHGFSIGGSKLEKIEKLNSRTRLLFHDLNPKVCRRYYKISQLDSTMFPKQFVYDHVITHNYIVVSRILSFHKNFLARRGGLHTDNILEMYSGGIWLKYWPRIPTSMNWKVLKFYSVTQRKFVGTTLK